MDPDNLWGTGPSLLTPPACTHRPASTTTHGLSLLHPALSSRAVAMVVPRLSCGPHSALRVWRSGLGVA